MLQRYKDRTKTSTAQRRLVFLAATFESAAYKEEIGRKLVLQKPDPNEPAGRPTKSKTLTKPIESQRILKTCIGFSSGVSPEGGPAPHSQFSEQSQKF